MKVGKKFIDSSSGYDRWKVWIYLPDGSRQKLFCSRLVAEIARKDILPDRAIVHHINGDTLDDRPENLVVCEDNAYHHLLHQREGAYRSTGNAKARKCNLCHQWGIPGDGDLVVYPKRSHIKGTGIAQHKSCQSNKYYKRKEIS